MSRVLYSPFGDEIVLHSIDWLENFPWRQDNGLVTKDKYEVRFNLKGFAPEEISVKTADGYVIVEAFHDEKKDVHGYISRKLTRRYPLPDGCVKEDVECKLSSDGILTNCSMEADQEQYCDSSDPRRFSEGKIMISCNVK